METLGDCTTAYCRHFEISYNFSFKDWYLLTRKLHLRHQSLLTVSLLKLSGQGGRDNQGVRGKARQNNELCDSTNDRMVYVPKSSRDWAEFAVAVAVVDFAESCSRVATGMSFVDWPSTTR